MKLKDKPINDIFPTSKKNNKQKNPKGWKEEK